MQSMRVAVIGTGAVGGYFGAKLAKSGFDVCFLARGQQLSAIQSAGLQIKSILGDFEVKEIRATDTIRDMGSADLVMVAVKAWQILQIREELDQITHPESIILPLQNGVLAADELSEVIDKKHIVGGVCRIISKVESPGVINHFGATPSIVMGELSNNSNNRLHQIKQIFDRAGIDSKISDSIELDIWKKFGFICIGGLMAVSRFNLGHLRQSEETRELMMELVTEIHHLAGKLNIDMGSEFVSRTLNFIDSLPADTTFSMARDIWEGKPSELEYLNGAVVKLSNRHGIETPLNRILYQLLKAIESDTGNQ